MGEGDGESKRPEAGVSEGDGRIWAEGQVEGRWLT